MQLMQVWLLDVNKFWTGECDFVKEVLENHATKNVSVGKVKPKWDRDLQDWIEGATEEEIQEWKDAQQIDNCPSKTTEEKVEELDQKLTDLQAMYFELLLEVQNK